MKSVTHRVTSILLYLRFDSQPHLSIVTALSVSFDVADMLNDIESISTDNIPFIFSFKIFIVKFICLYLIFSKFYKGIHKLLVSRYFMTRILCVYSKKNRILREVISYFVTPAGLLLYIHSYVG